MNAKVFINYRREDTAPYAGRLYDRLTEHFGKGQVFIDIDKIEPGEDFVEAINRKIGACDVAIVAIGPHWLGARDASGKRRLDYEEDFVRMEIVAALQRNIRVIPVLVGGARMPRRQDLPEALAPLSRRNAIELSEIRFGADVNRLIEAIEGKGRRRWWNRLKRRLRQLFQKERAVWRRKRLVIVTTVGAAVIMLLTIAGLLWIYLFGPSANYAKAMKLATGLGGTRIDLPKAAEYLQRAAANKVPEADARLAYWVNNGVSGVAKDNVKATQWANKAFADGLAAKATNGLEAQFELAALYQDGLGVSQDFEAAAELYQKAADKGYAPAQNNLGVLYENGTLAPPGMLRVRNEEKDLKKAAELYQKAADQGYASAQNNLGRLYQNGHGVVTTDLGKAVELYQKAADQGFARAQNNLGRLYYNGEGVSKDFGRAAELYQKAANQGCAPAENNLGWLFEHGQGVPRDLRKAAELYQKAANQDDKNAVANLKRVSGH